MKKTISIRFTPKNLDLPAIGGGDTNLLKAKLQQRWPDLIKEIQTEKLAAGALGLGVAVEAIQNEQANEDDGSFVDVDGGPDFIDVTPVDDQPDEPDGQDGADEPDGQDGADGADGAP